MVAKSGLVRALLAFAMVCALGCGPPPVRTRVAKVRPLSPAAYSHYLRGRIAVIEGDYDRAVAELNKASLAAPTEAAIRVAYIDALYRTGAKKRARGEVESAQKRWPSHAGVWLLSGRIYRGLSEHTAAVKALEKAIDLDPETESAYLNLASAWLTLGHPGRAEKSYRRLLRRDRDSVEGHYQLAVRLMTRSAWHQAERQLEQVVELDPDHLKALVALAQTRRSLGKKRESIQVLREAFDRSGGDADLGEKLVIDLLEMGSRREAVDLLDSLDRSDLPARVRLSLGRLYLQIGEADSALHMAESILEVHPASASTRVLRAQALIMLQRRSEAVPVLLEIPESATQWPGARGLAAELLAQDGKIEEARKLVDEALGAKPNEVDLLIASSTVYEHAKRPAKARQVLETAVERDPDDTDLLYAWGALEDRLGDSTKALELMERVLVNDSSNVSAMNFIGYSLADRSEDLPRAEKLLSRALELAPADGYVLDSFGWLRFRQKRLKDAEDLITRAHRLAPAVPEIVWHMAEIAAARGKRIRAVQLLRKAKALRPDPQLGQRIETRIEALSN